MPLRIATYNVHGFVGPDGLPNPSRVVRLLRRLDCDVVALQEVTRGFGFRVPRRDGGGMPPDIDVVARVLGMRVVEANAGWGSNVVLARIPLLRAESVPLGDGPAGPRSAALATLETPCGAIVFASTHLDVLDESARVRQLRALAGAIGRREAVVLGDFNSLRFADYSRARLREIAEEREDADVEEPREAVVRAADALGWVDIVRLGLAGSHGRYAASLREPLHARLAATCAFGTRIDYVWATAGFAARVRVVGSRVVASDASDHRPVVVTLARRRALA